MGTARPLTWLEHASIVSFFHDTMEEAYEKLLDACCRLLPLLELGLLQKLLLSTVVLLLKEEFLESAHLKPDRPTEWDEADRTITAVCHVVRLLYLLLLHLAGEVKLPAAGLERLVCELYPCTYATRREVFKHAHRRPGSLLGARVVFSHGELLWMRIQAGSCRFDFRCNVRQVQECLAWLSDGGMWNKDAYESCP